MRSDSLPPELWSTDALFGYCRGDQLEVVIHGWNFFADGEKPLEHPAADSIIITRSLLKPWQFLATGLVEDRIECALGLASQSAQPKQTDVLVALQKHYGVDAKELQCPEMLPMDVRVADALKAKGVTKSRQYHPCAGKHSFALAACKKNHWPTENYLQREHPLQVRLTGMLNHSCGDKVKWGVDSCGLPTAVISVRDLLRLWHDLATSTEPEKKTIRKLWGTYPEIVGGVGRLDTDIVKAADGKVMAKEGADGLLVVQAIPETSAARAQSCLIKIASGFNADHLALGLLALLRQQQRQLQEPLQKVLNMLESRVAEFVPRGQSLRLPPSSLKSST